MKNVVVLVILAGIFYSCQHKNTVPPMPIWKEFVLEEPLAHLVDSFTCKYDNCELYELYIDRITSDSCVALITVSPKQSEEKEKGNIQPIAQILSNKRKVNVYCGIENFITLIDYIPVDSLTNQVEERKIYPYIVSFLIRISKNKVNIENSDANPFDIVTDENQITFLLPPLILK